MKGHFFSILILPAFILTTPAAWAEQKIIQMGGGNKILNSQGQIEDNVIWLNTILRKVSNDITNFYAAGNSGEKDVAIWDKNLTGTKMEPITRVFGEPDDNRLIFRANAVPSVSGSMRKKVISESLSAMLRAQRPAQDILLIYNGHGGINEKDVCRNTLKVWGEEVIDVGEVDTILDTAPGGATVRFIFPQCYSGGFYSLIFEEPGSDKISEQNRCGFFSQSSYEESEGCSLDTNREEYRDYSSYFFAPLSGGTRNHTPLPLQADMDDDGAVTFRESHLYALMVGEGKDSPRSTSEIYLEKWTPWYLRWDSRFANRDSVYWKIAEYLSGKYHFAMDGKSLSTAKRILQSGIDEETRKQEKYSDDITLLKNKIKVYLSIYWPELFQPYTSAFNLLIDTRTEQILNDITLHSSYQDLVISQKQLSDSRFEQLEKVRLKAQINKIIQMKRLARMEHWFHLFASESDKRHYARLLSCEEGLFFKLSEIE